VLEDAAGLAELRRLGARSVPILSRGDDFVFAQNIAQVVAFLKLDERAGPVLSPDRLVARLDKFLDAALRVVAQMPDDRLDIETPGRPRKYRRLAHHMFRIPEAFLEAEAGAMLTQESPGAVRDPAEMASTAALTAYGRRVRERVADWWREEADRSGQKTLQTYYGPQKLHEVLERTTWHVAQHTRQWVMLLGMAGIAADYRLGDADFADLPMPREVWDG
jgi:hypothetical protein